ncbi:MAG: MAPEG family protein [Woeseiaceae bacterium]|nr:MAPEG family protein [Woeseiaceae bacterium]MDX2607974.1 MAPEG family protein [Woeseiaceae bacterium]
MEYTEYTAIVTLLALMQFMLFSIQVGAMRVKHGVKAPATAGHPEFERMFRVQQNTMEQLVVFVPALWIYAYLVNPLWGAGIGLLFIIGRFVYRAAYLKDPASRSNGFTIGVLAIAVLLVWSFVAAVISLI